MFRRKDNLPTETPVLNKDTGVFENRIVESVQETKRQKNKKKRKERKADRKAARAQRRWPVTVVVINILLLIVMIVQCVYTSSMLTFLKNQNAYILDTTGVSLTEIATMKSDIESTLEQENSLLESWKIELTDTDFSREKYTVRVEIIPKEYTESMETYIYFGTDEYELKREGFVYSGYASLPLTESYDGNVTVLFVDGNKRSTEIMKNFSGVNANFEEVLSGTLEQKPLYKDNSLKFSTNCNVKLDNKKYYHFEELSLVVEVDGNDVAQYALGDLTDENNTIEGVKVTESGEPIANNLIQNPLPNSEDTDELDQTEETQQGEEIEENIKNIDGSYSWSDTIELDVQENISEGRNVRIYLKAYCDEGYTFTYDLFNGITNVSTQENVNAEGFQASDNYYMDNAQVKDLKGGVYMIKKQDDAEN